MTNRDAMAFASGMFFAVLVRDLQAGDADSALVWAAFLALSAWRWSRS